MHKYSNKYKYFKFTFGKVMRERGSEVVIKCDVINIYSKQIIKSIKESKNHQLYVVPFGSL